METHSSAFMMVDQRKFRCFPFMRLYLTFLAYWFLRVWDQSHSQRGESLLASTELISTSMCAIMTTNVTFYCLLHRFLWRTTKTMTSKLRPCGILKSGIGWWGAIHAAPVEQTFPTGSCSKEKMQRAQQATSAVHQCLCVCQCGKSNGFYSVSEQHVLRPCSNKT